MALPTASATAIEWGFFFKDGATLLNECDVVGSFHQCIHFCDAASEKGMTIPVAAGII
jgi:hypothetical protein